MVITLRKAYQIGIPSSINIEEGIPKDPRTNHDFVNFFLPPWIIIFNNL
ncbi:hypothetical protein RINTHH_21610 [Richelia intracellularis HH01]|uniref:Uncharacterized protein n=1 Tax=Richelia intracellularis HH01 TaxID=1165094 RepID=M1X6P3_9NOST|nr:hypothetical protein RINTHH_21610 [Richelia intracellularis HH01]